MWTVLSIAIALLFTLVASGREAADLPHARTPREFRDAVRNTHWLRAVVLVLWFLIAFSTHLVEALGRSAFLATGLLVKVSGWASTQLRDMATPSLTAFAT